MLDHVIIAVRDLDESARRYEAILGRPVAVRSRHPRGTRNALFLFPRGPYLELISTWGSDEQGSSAAAVTAFLRDHGDGLHGLALAPSDVDAALARLRALGFEAGEPVANHGVNEDGRRRDWRGAFMPDTAGEMAFFVEHCGWDWRTELQAPPLPGREAGAATRIHHVAYDLADPVAASGAWTERFGLPRVETITSERMGALVLVHAAGDAFVEFVGATRPDGPVAGRMQRRGHGLSSLAFEVADLDAAVESVRRSGIKVGDHEPGVLPHSRVARLDPASACGVAAQLVQFE